MTLKIERTPGRQRTRIRLSGELRQEDLDQLRVEMARGGRRLALDLEEVGLIDVQAIRFLNACEDEGADVVHRSLFIKEWMFQERVKQDNKP